jgi:CMP-N,N'-diacetyllegionaminic acid synthase
MPEIDLAVIPARGGSKAIPHKNIKPLAGKPLIAWTIEAALHCRKLSRLIVSTDDPEIAKVALQWGAEVPFLRPAELARDESSSLSVVLHLIHWFEEQGLPAPEHVLLLQPTSPFRTTEDIEAAIELAGSPKADAVVSVCEAKVHPFLCKRIREDGMLADFIPSNMDYERRQDLPPAYNLNGAIYLNRCETLLGEGTFLPRNTLPYVMPPERSLDLDTLLEWHLAELMLEDKHES